MKGRTCLLESRKILSVGATALLIGCAGVSSRTTVSGTGPAASTHTVDLSWNASTSPHISGYNIYRAPYTNSCGSFTKVNQELNTSTSYTDSTVTGGISYCYATTAVNVSNEESSFSNIVPNVQVPAP